MGFVCCCSLFLEIVHNSPDSTEIELTKDGLWHITGTEDVDENSCGSPRAEAHEMPGKSWRTIKCVMFMQIYIGPCMVLHDLDVLPQFKTPCGNNTNTKGKQGVSPRGVHAPIIIIIID